MKRSFLLVLLFVFSFMRSLDQPTTDKAIIIMGASCAGKSTLSAKLLNLRGNRWKLIEFDAIEDEFKASGTDAQDSFILQEVVVRANKSLLDGWNIIIDTNYYDEILRTITAADKKFILIHCPLEVLLKRNARRDTILQRTPARSRQARAYVEKTFHNFKAFDAFDIKIDSSQESVEEIMARWAQKLS
jgi:chloramphenicol 3-O-phosphotransferase